MLIGGLIQFITPASEHKMNYSSLSSMQGGLLPSGEVSSKGDILIIHSIAKVHLVY
jgi:hypothetical protein